MSKINDQTYLLKDQYRDSANLDARVRVHRLFSTNKYGWNHWYFDQLDLPATARILELGCGPGYLWRDNLARLPASWDVTLSDFSAGMLDRARENLHERDFRYEQIDAQAIPFDDHTFDTVIANHMLYHVPDRATALREMRRVLKPGGAAYIATNGNRHLAELYDLKQRFDPAINFGWGARAHEVFSLDSGDAEVREVFATVDVRRYDDNLIVTEVQPLVEYVLSMVEPAVAAARRAELTAFIEREMNVSGRIFIAKDSGMFIAR